MRLTNKAVEGELKDWQVRKSEDDMSRWEGGERTWTAKAVFPTPPSPNTATRQQSISGKGGGIGRVLRGKEGMERTLITMDGEKVHRNLSGENEWRERDGIRGEDDLERRILERKGGDCREEGIERKEDEGRVWSCRVVRGEGGGEGGESTERVSVRVRDCE
jgi:hypothetical protein